jgi:hypothetical protein
VAGITGTGTVLARRLCSDRRAQMLCVRAEWQWYHHHQGEGRGGSQELFAGLSHMSV